MVYNKDMENISIPSLSGNFVDLILVIVFLVYIFDGIKKGFLIEILELLGFLISFFFAIKFYNFVGLLLVNNFSLPRGIANALGFLILGFLIEGIFSGISMVLFRKVPKGLMGSVWDKIFGIIPALFNAVIISAFVLTLLITLPIKGDIKANIISSKIGGSIVAETAGFEKQLNKIFGGAVTETLTFLTVKQDGEEKIDLKYKVLKRDLTIDEKSEEDMFVLVNNERRANELGNLVVDNILTEAGRKHCLDMFERGYFSHYTPEGLSPFDRLKQMGIIFSAAGENLALAPSVSIAHTGLMNSPGHRANILSSDFGKIGVAVIDGGIYGKMFCQEFTD